MNRCFRCVLGLILAMACIALCCSTLAAQTTSAQDPLIQVLVNKGVLSASEAKTISGTADQQRDRLVQLLKDKGVLSAAEYKTVAGTAPAPSASLVPVVYTQAAPAAPKEAPKPPAPTVIPAVAPVRVFQFEPAKAGGMIPDIKLGSGAKVKLYGFVKASAAYDSSSPAGNDFPLPGLVVGLDTGPDKSPEFHIKARNTRIGANFEFPDISSKVAVTGKIEFDWEGDFTRVSNRNVSSIRSSQPSLRLAWGRVDYKATPQTSFFLLAGQDWSPFGSSILPNIVEGTIYGAFFGNLYEREPQMRVGLTHNFGGARNFTIGPEFAIVLPAWGTPPGAISNLGLTFTNCTPVAPATTCAGVGSDTGTALANQLAYGERQGVDSAKPGVEGRLVFQFQADRAKGVAPMQIVLSGMHRNRTAIVPRATLTNTALLPTTNVNRTAFLNAFPQGLTVDTDAWGLAGGFSLPTRYVTVIANYYRGTGLRWYFGAQAYTGYNDVSGRLQSATAVVLPTIDGSAPSVAIGCALGSVTCVPAVAGQLEPRTQGGFVNVGFPLSRIAHANPAGRNAGWTMNLHYGYDAPVARDARRAANSTTGIPSSTGNRLKSDLALANLNYKLNQFVTFSLEQSYYRTRFFNGCSTAAGSVCLVHAGSFPAYAGFPAKQWQDMRTEFFTTFTF